MKCSKCGNEKEYGDGYCQCSICRAKSAAYTRQYHREHPEKNRLNVRRWRDKYPEKRRALTRKYKDKLRRTRPLRYEYEMLKKRARKIGLREIIDYDDYAKLVIMSCHYCGAAPVDRGRGPRNGLDRVNNELGYVQENVVTACVTCNFAKGTLSIGEFLAWVERVARHSGLVQ